jgi:hypothetical protein
MKFLWHRYSLAFVAIAGFLAAAGSATADELQLDASTPEVNISTRPVGINFIRLPSLGYRFSVDARCTGGRQPQLISLSIADTRVSVPTADLAQDGPIEVEMTVPADQIGPIPLNEFCVSDDSNSTLPQTSLTIPSVLSAQASLLCAGESGSEMSYASASLDVELSCESADEPQTQTID